MGEFDYLYDITGQLIAADTVSHHASTPALEALANHLESHGFEVTLQRWEGGDKANLIAKAGPDEPDGLVLSGHIDVVPFETQPGWERDPLVLGIEGETLFGRGTTDMKGFLGQCLDATRRLDVATLRRPLILLFTSDEEVGCQGGARLADDLPRLLGPTPPPRLAWIGEPTGWKVAHAHKGVAGFGVEARGEGGHSSLPEQGVNAIGVAARAIVALGELQEALRREGGSDAMGELFPEAPYATMNFGTIEGGSASNMIAESCRFSVSYRPLPDRDPLEVYERAKAALLALDAREWGSPREGSLEISAPFVAPGVHAARGTALEAALLAEFSETTVGGVPFCTDAGQFARSGLECLICGPGALDQAHQPNESLDRAAFEQGPDRILAVTRRLLVE